MRSQLCNRREISKVDQKDVGFRDTACGFIQFYGATPPSPRQSRGFSGKQKRLRKNMLKSRHNYPFCSLKHSVGYLPYTENSRAIKVKDVTALYIVRSAGIGDGDINSNDWHFSPTFHYGSGKIVVLN